MHVPDLCELEELRVMAEKVVKPQPGQRVLIVVVDEKEEAAMFASPDDGAAERDNVHPLHGGPVMSGEEERQEQRSATAEMLLSLAEEAERGEIRHAAVIVGVETNEPGICSVGTVTTLGIHEHMAAFLGGCTILQRHIMDEFEDAVMGDGA